MADTKSEILDNNIGEKITYKSEILDNNIGKKITYTPKDNSKSAQGILVSYTYDKATDNLTINIKGDYYGTTKVENIKRVDILDKNDRFDTLQYDIPQLFPQLSKTETEATSGWQWPFAGKQEEPAATPGPGPETAAPTETPGSGSETPGSGSETTAPVNEAAPETTAPETAALGSETTAPGSESTEKKGLFSRFKKNISSKASNFKNKISSRFSGKEASSDNVTIDYALPAYIDKAIAAPEAAAAAGGSKKSKTCKRSKKCKKSKTCKKSNKSNKSKKTRKSKK